MTNLQPELVRHREPLFAWDFLAVSVLCLISTIAAAQSSPSSTSTQPNSDASVPKAGTRSTLPPEPPRPDYLPKEAVWTGMGWNAPLAPWDRYGMLFESVIRFDRAADDAEKRGEDGKRYRDLLKEKYGLTEAQAQDLRQIAIRCRQQTDEIDQMAEAISKTYRATIPKDAPPFGPERWKVVPPPPKELTDLELRRESAIMTEAEVLKATLGPEAAAKIEQDLNRMGNVDLTPKPLSPEEVDRRRKIDQQHQKMLNQKRGNGQNQQQLSLR